MTLESVEGWSQVPVCDNGEPLVRVTHELSLRLRVENKYYTVDKLPEAIEGIWVRESLLPMLKIAAELLPEKTFLLIWDAFRPLSLQRLLSNQVKRNIHKSNERMTPEVMCQEAMKYAADPDYNISSPPPHLTGGSVDVCMLNSDGDMLEMGTKRDHIGPEASTNYFENKAIERKLNVQEITAFNNRQILCHAMTQAGFTNYYHEWWHFDYGNQFWGILTGQTAVYGETNLSTK